MTYDITPKLYTPLWNKYRPAILKMMLDSEGSPQSYKLSAHEFKAMNAKQKGGYGFTLQVSKGKVTNNIKDSIIARELLDMLRGSAKASAWMEEGTYEIVMDKQFVLHITSTADVPKTE